ncbi:MAG: FHA domain-containing protein [Myxococcales bacterium]|nr:FHA domain-containing protein [Myxococcales bacterium]
MATLGLQLAMRPGPNATTYALPAYCVVGRAPASDMLCADPSVSGQHAAFQWTGSEWLLHDLGSRNGTIVDNRRVFSGGRATLTVGSRLQFGADPSVWIVRDLTPPPLMAQQLTRRVVRVAHDGVLTLPDERTHWRVSQDASGAWVASRGGESRPIEDRAILAVDAELWRVYLPQARGDRPQGRAVDLSATFTSGLPSLAAGRR